MGATIGWGILGTGKIARILAAAISESSTGYLVAVGSRSAERASAFAAEFGVPNAYGDYEGVLQDPGVTIAYIATYHPDHVEWTTRAAEAGKHVLCEKPLALNHAGATRIVEAARRNDVALMEAFAYRYHPQTARLLEVLRSGAIGEVRMIDAVFGYDAGPKPTNYLLVHELGGGGILDVGCYTTSMAALVAGALGGRGDAEPEDVSGIGVLDPQARVDLSAVAGLRFPGGIVARLACAINANLESSLRVYGTGGRLTVPSPWLPGRIGSRATILVERPETEPEEIEIPLEAEVYTTEVDAVTTLVEAGARSVPQMTWDDSLANIRTLDRWRAAIGLAYDQEARVAERGLTSGD